MWVQGTVFGQKYKQTLRCNSHYALNSAAPNGFNAFWCFSQKPQANFI